MLTTTYLRGVVSLSTLSYPFPPPPPSSTPPASVANARNATARFDKSVMLRDHAAVGVGVGAGVGRWRAWLGERGAANPSNPIPPNLISDLVLGVLTTSAYNYNVLIVNAGRIVRTALDRQSRRHKGKGSYGTGRRGRRARGQPPARAAVAAAGPFPALPPGNRSFCPGVVLARMRWISTRVLDKLRFGFLGSRSRA